MTARVVITAPADADIENILGDLAREAGVGTAATYGERLRRLLRRLEDHPDSGPLRPTLGAHIRIGALSPYLVFYRHVPGEEIVSIVRVLHGRRRITRHNFSPV